MEQILSFISDQEQHLLICSFVMFFLYIWLIFYSSTSNKATNNLSLLKRLYQYYNDIYNLNTYRIECIAHLFNNIIRDILLIICFTDKDDAIVWLIANSTEYEKDNDKNQQEDCEIQSKFWFFFL